MTRNSRSFALDTSLWLGLALLACAAGIARADDYRIQKGDVLQLFIAGATSMREELPVDINGNVVVPLAGPIASENRTLQEVSDEIQDRIAVVSIPIVGENGTLTSQRIHPSLVSVSILSYRPVYVDGKVREPGAHAFAPGMTARQAIAVSGGIGQALAETPELELAATEATLLGLRARLAAADTAIAALERELDPSVAGDGGTRTAVRRERLLLDVGYYQDAVTAADTQILSLEEQLSREEAATQDERAAFERIRNTDGLVTAVRVNEARRDVLFAESRMFETKARLAQAVREKSNLENQRAQRGLEDREAILGELDGQKKLRGDILASISTEQARYTALSGHAPGDGNDVRIAVTRMDGTTVELQGVEDIPLQPGDRVTVTVPSSVATQ